MPLAEGTRMFSTILVVKVLELTAVMVTDRLQGQVAVAKSWFISTNYHHFRRQEI